MALYNPLLIKKLEGHLKDDPKSKSFGALAQIYFSMGELDKAEKLCVQGLEHHPSYSQAYLILSGIYNQKGQVDKALQCLNQAKSLNPDNPRIYQSLGEIYRKQNDMQKTLDAYKMLVFLRPEDKTAISTVQHLEKVMGQSLLESEGSEEAAGLAGSAGKSEGFAPSANTSVKLSAKLSEKQRQKLLKLNEILARVEMYIQQRSKGS